jgi:Fungal Zn(2)-Cys(6) binuclear cluster domain
MMETVADASLSPPRMEPDGSTSDTAAATMTAPTASKGSSIRIRRRNRMITSCLECRRRKLKCDRLHPCSNCSKAQRDCVFMAPALDAAARLKLMELKEKMGSLERLLERDVAPSHGQQTSESKEDASETLFATVEAEDRERTIPDDEKDLEPTRLAVQDVAYEDEADDEMYDLGFRLGKMRMTERVGGFFRPRIADEVRRSGNFRLPYFFTCTLALAVVMVNRFHLIRARSCRFPSVLSPRASLTLFPANKLFANSRRWNQSYAGTPAIHTSLPAPICYLPPRGAIKPCSNFFPTRRQPIGSCNSIGKPFIP